MSGRLPRLICTAALAVGTALAPQSAAAAPDPDRPGQRSTADLLTDFQQIYRDTERATQAYDGTQEMLTGQRAEVDRLQRELARARLALQDSRSAVGRLARQQYQAVTGVSPYVRLLLARDPQHALEEGHVIGRLSRERAALVRRLTVDQRRATALARAARAALDRQLSLSARQKKDHDAVHTKLAGVEALLAALTPEQIAAVRQSEKDAAAKGQQRSAAAGALGPPGAQGTQDAQDAQGASGTAAEDDKPSAPGRRAVRYALRQLGKPYRWGAQGPDSYDCSGLTSQAWAHAGTPVPRTSQEQWARLPRVPLSRLRPGDLVVYFPDATHVALYIGDGKVVQAPRPGEDVKVSPLGFAPVLGAVRPNGSP